MAFFLSPLVSVAEIDLSTSIGAVATSIGVAVLRNTYKGPEEKVVFISTIDELVSKFGEPTDTANCYKDILSANGYLKFGNKLYCSRAMPISAAFAGTVATSATTGSDYVPYISDPLSAANGKVLANVAGLSRDPDNFHDQNRSMTDPMWFIAASRGAWGDKIRIGIVNKNAYDSVNEGTTPTSGWDSSYVNTIDSIDSPLTTDKEFLVVVQAQGQRTSDWVNVEYWNVSTDPNVVDDEGQKKFAPTVINESSNYIRIAISESQIDTAIEDVVTDNFQQFGGGLDANGDSVTDTEVKDAYDLYNDPETIDVNILIDSDKSNTVKEYIDSICQSRMDCMCTLDVAFGDVVYNKGNEVTDLKDFRLTDLNINSSYSALYGNWLEVYDKWNGKYRWIPSSGHMAGIFANTDDVSDPWFAPAGLNRAIITNVRKLAWSPTLGQRDILYKNGINPIVSFAGQGKVVWGQKTLLDKNSAFNRINVRRLFITLEKAISTAMKYFVFEPNDTTTRLLIENMVTPFLRDVKSRRGIYDFLFVSDETNNTPERVDRNELWIDIYIKPVRAAEFIVLNFIATKTGASFTELAAAISG